MKRLLIVVIFLITTLTLSAQITEFKASSFKLNAKGVAGEWVPSKVLITINPETRRIIIYSELKQIIDYTSPQVEKTEEYTVIEADATDINNKKMGISILIFNSGIVHLIIFYKDMNYSYEMRLNE